MRLRAIPLLTSACVYALSAQLAGAALTGLALPPLDLSGLQHAGGWSSANTLVFTDLMKHSSVSFSAGTRTAGTNNSWGYLSPSTVTWRSDGYPAGLTPPNNRTQWSVITVIGSGRVYYKAGRYVVLYDGDGSLVIDGDAANPPVSSAAGRLVVEVTPNNSTAGLRVRITSSNASNPLVNIRIVPEAYESTYNTTQVFHPDFLDMLQGIPLLRFAAWNRATSNADSGRAAPRDWAARTTPLHSTQVREADGVAVEHLVQLANIINASMWISLPRAANNSDPYIFNMVRYIAANLSSSLSLTVEYGKEAPGWLSSHLPTNTKLISEVARRAWVAGGRSLSQLRVVMTCPSAGVLSNVLYYAGTNYSFIDAIALPASFGGGEYFSATYENPTGWASGGYFQVARPAAASVDSVLKLMRSSVITADVMYNKVFQRLRTLGIPVIGYAAGPELRAPMYGSRTNYDRSWTTCGGNVSWPCNITTVYPPWSFPDGSSAIVWANRSAFNGTFYGPLAANASTEAAVEDVLRQVRMHDNMTQIVLDSLWRWHAQMGGGDLVVDVSRLAISCNEAAGIKTASYAPAECRTSANGTAVATSTARPTDVPAYKALMAWLAAVGPNATTAATAAPGALPQSAATAPLAVPRPANCSPSCVYGTCVNGTCKCWAGVSGATCDELPSEATGTPSACNPRVGINLEGISDWSRSWTFVDVFKASRQWISQGFVSTAWSTGTYVTLINSSTAGNLSSALGYPAFLEVDQKVSTLVMRDLMGHLTEGVYTVLFDGKGVLDFAMYDVKNVEWVEAGHVRVTFKPSTNMNNGILVMLERTDPSDPLRNIRVLTPGYEAASEFMGLPFHPALLSYLRPFGMLRFMDWMRTNGEATPREWSERPTTQDRSYAVTSGGVPLEYMILLCNMLGADPWFNIPFAATDDYISRFAAAVRDGLRPDLRVYVEYGNELWGTGFPGGQYAQAQGLAMNLTEEGSKWYGGATNEARLCFVAHRTANISKLWKASWGAQSGRVQVVVSGQSVWPITSDKLLRCGNASLHIDALAIAPYFGYYNKTRDTNVTVFVNETLRAQLNETFAQVAEHAKIAAKYGKPLLTYESGQGLIGDGTSDDVAIQANRHPLMAEIYQLYLSGLVANNVSRIMHFSSIGAFSKYGSWGLMEYQDEDRREAPKYQGLMTFLNASLNCSLPLPPDPATCPGSCSGNGDCLADGTCMCYSGYSGANCSNVTYTEIYNCGYYCTFGQGWCNVSSVSGNVRTWGCTCKSGISGLTCSIVSCPNNCSWNGDCIDQGICACYPGFSGSDCSTDCGCGGHGRCDDNGDCICDVGWRMGESGVCEWDCSTCADEASCVGPGECGCAESCIYGTCYHGACRCWAGFGGPACSVSEAEGAAAGVPRLNRGSLAGINVAGVAYYTTEWVWLDVMKVSSDWFTSYLPDTALENAWDTQADLELRPDGYPARLPDNTMAHKLILRNVLLHAWPGRYVVLYDGDGRLDFAFDATVSSRAKGRIEILFTPTADLVCAATGAAYCSDNGISIRLTATNPENPLRNIRILPLGDPSSGSAGGAGAGGAWEGRISRATFHPWFLKSMARYRIIRFMNWMDTNTNTSWISPEGQVLSGSEAWAARTTPAHDTQTRDGGVAYEYMIELCNLLGADPWFTVHHLADDAYVTELATLVRDKLRPDVNVYIEHSNEVWNPLFSQNAYARVRGMALSLSSDATKASYRYHALRTTQIGNIFKTVFATAPGAGSQRIKVVLGGWSYLCSNGLGCGAVVAKETLGWNGTAAKVDFYGLTGYWSCGLGSSGATDVLLSVDEMLTKCKTSLNATANTTAALVALVLSYNVSPIAYEAGPSIVESSSIERGSATAGLATKFIALNRHADMYGLYKSYLEVFHKGGLVGEGRPFMQFVSTGLSTKYGSWGLQEYTGQPVAEAHKYRALMDWLDNQANYTGVTPDATNTPSRRAKCMDLRAQGGSAAGVSGAFGGGGVALAEGLLAGPPAVMLPAAGQVFVQGQTVTIRWSTVGWDDGTYNGTISLWADTDCLANATTDSQQQLNDQSLAVMFTGMSQSGSLQVRMPAPGELPALDSLVAEIAEEAEDEPRHMPRFFLRFSDGRTTNYSEPFDVIPPYVYIPGSWSECACSPSTPVQTRDLMCIDTSMYVNSTEALPHSHPPPDPPTPTCTNYTGWVVQPPSAVGDPYCSVTASTGCRTYRTERSGKWPWSGFKPVTDCTAQSSPWPASSSSLTSMLTMFVPLSLCSSTSTAGTEPSTTRACPAGICSSSPISSSPPPPASLSPPPPPVVLPYCSQSSTAAQLALLNAGTTTCDVAAESSSSTCGDASVCAAVSNCKRWVCNASSQSLVQESCSALCQPRILAPVSAKLSDDGRSVLVTLSARAVALVRVPCRYVFEAASAEVLGGGGSLCSTTSDDTVLVAGLAANATVALDGQQLVMRSSGSRLVAAADSSRAFSGSVKVSGCTSCVSPTARLSGPTSLPATTTCESASGSLLGTAATRAAPTFDASASEDPSGRTRWAAVRWSYLGAAAEGALLSAAIERSNNMADVSDRLRLSLTTDEEAALTDNVTYTVQVTVTSWLGTSSSASLSFYRPALAAGALPSPSVSVSGPATQTFRISSGLRLTASVAGGGCKGRTLYWRWSSPSGWSGLPTTGLTSQTLSLRGPVSGITHGQNVTLRVTASYENTSASSSSSSSSSANVVVLAQGAPPLAALTGPSGDISNDTALVFNATASSDPDATAAGSTANLTYVWSCRRDDTSGPCFTSAQQGDKSSNPGVWSIPAGLIASGSWYTVTVTVLKDTSATAADSAPLNASASTTFRPRSASLPFPRGILSRQCSAVACASPHSTDQDLTVLLQLASPYNTTTSASTVTVTWSSTDAPSITALTALTALNAPSYGLPAGAYLLTIPSFMLPTTRSSLTITANLASNSTSVSGDAATGAASLTVPVNGAPYCSFGSNASSCLATNILNATFPSAVVVLRARGWVDGGDGDDASVGLRYEFGVRQVVGSTTVNVVQQRGAAMSATLVGLAQGVVQLYGCAIDTAGSRTCGLVNVTVAPPGANFDATAALAAINVTALVAANDQTTLLQAALQTAQLVLTANSSSSGSNSTAISKLLGDMSVALVSAMMSGGALQDAEQAPQAIAAMAALASSATTLPDKAKDAYMAAVQSAVQLLAANASASSSGAATGSGLTSFISQLCSLMGATLPSASSTINSTNNSISVRRLAETVTAASASNSSTSAAARSRLADLLAASNQIGDALGRQVVPRGPYMAAGASGVFVSAAAIPPASSSGNGSNIVQTSVTLMAGPDAAASATTSKTNSARRRLHRFLLESNSSDPDVGAQLVLAGTAATSASGYGVDLSYISAAAPALTSALVTALPTSVSLLSGLTTVTWNPPSSVSTTTATPSLDGNTSYLLLNIPISKYNASRTLACLSYNVTNNSISGNLTGLAAGGGSVLVPSYNATSGKVSCRVAAAGSYVVAQGQSAAVSPEDEKESHTAVIVGAVVGGVGGLLVLVGVVVAAVVLARRGRQVQVQPGSPSVLQPETGGSSQQLKAVPSVAGKDYPKAL